MRTIKNKSFNFLREVFQQDPVTNKLSIVQRETKTNYFEVMCDMLRQPPPEGWKTGLNIQKQLSTRLDLIDTLSKDKSENSEVMIEESEYEELLAAYRNWNFVITSREVLGFDTYLLGVEKTILN